MSQTYERTVRAFYPLASGRLVLRTSEDWNRVIEAEEAGKGNTSFTFRVRSARPYVYAKVCWADGAEPRWAVGNNTLVVLTEDGPRDVYPFFFEDARGDLSPLMELPASNGASRRARVYLPPGYGENHLKRYPVVYMLDGQNLFLPEEAFQQREWRLDETLDVLDAMSAMDRMLVVGLWSDDRERDYTAPGYESYGRWLVEEAMPWIDRELRTLPGPARTAVMGSSLGGVAAFYLGWQWPRSFGTAASLSGTFGFRDDLIERVLSEPARPVRFYLDSGWPEDNFEVTRSLAQALRHRGWGKRDDLLYFAFPLAAHNEEAWAARVHLPIQFFVNRG